MLVVRQVLGVLVETVMLQLLLVLLRSRSEYVLHTAALRSSVFRMPSPLTARLHMNRRAQLAPGFLLLPLPGRFEEALPARRVFLVDVAETDGTKLDGRAR